MSIKYCSCIQYLSILRVFAVSEGAAVYRRNKVLAETGGAVSALTPEVSTLCYVNKYPE